MWLTSQVLNRLAGWIPAAAPYLTPDSLGDGRHASGAYLENVTARMKQSGEHQLAHGVERAAY